MASKQDETDKRIYTLLAEQLSFAMEAKGMSLRDLARQIDGSYENVRKIVRGETSPSIYLLKVICQTLDLDYHTMNELANEDKIRRKYGDIPLKMSGLDEPSLEPVVRVWGKLTAQQQKAIISMATGWAKQNESGVLVIGAGA